MKKEGREQRLDKGHRMENRNEKKEKKLERNKSENR